MKPLESLAIFVLLLAISQPLLAQPKSVALSFSMLPGTLERCDVTDGAVPLGRILDTFITCRETSAGGANLTALSFQSAATQSAVGKRGEFIASASPADRPSVPIRFGDIAMPRREVDRLESRPIRLSYSQKQALVLAYRAGNHYGIGLLYAAVIFQESKLCHFTVGDHGKAHGCAQLHEGAVKAVTGTTLTSWELTDPNTEELNLAIGARYLDLCLQRFGYPAGVGAYNTGIPRAAKMGRVRLSRLPYTKAVLANMKILRQLPISED